MAQRGEMAQVIPSVAEILTCLANRRQRRVCQGSQALDDVPPTTIYSGGFEVTELSDSSNSFHP